MVQIHMPEGAKARRVYLSLHDGITGGALPRGTRLPGEARLAEAHGVSRVTVRRALGALARDGLIETRTGAGSVVTAGQPAPLAGDIASLMPQLEHMSRHAARLISFAYGPAAAPVAAALGLRPGARVQTAVRVRLAGQQPFSHLTTHVPEAIARGYDEADLAATPLFRLLERSGVELAGAEQSVSATLAAPEVAEALEVAEGSALIALRRVVRDRDGRGVEHLAALYRPDLFRFDMTLARVGAADARHWQPVVGAVPDTLSEVPRP